MVSFVDDQQLEPVAELAHVAPTAFKGCHRDGFHLVLAVAQQARRKARAFAHGAGPLVEQNARGHQTQGGHAQASDGRDGQAGLARASGQNRHPAPVGQRPGRKRRLLVGAQIGGPESRQIVRWTGHLVLEPDTALAQLGQ